MSPVLLFKKFPIQLGLGSLQEWVFSRANYYIFREKKCDKEVIASLKERIQYLEKVNRNKSDYLKNILRVVPANIYWKDTNCVILGGNLSHAQQAGFSDPAEVIGKTDYDFIWKDAAKELIETDLKIMRSGKGMQLEEVGILADGLPHTFFNG